MHISYDIANDLFGVRVITDSVASCALAGVRPVHHGGVVINDDVTERVSGHGCVICGVIFFHRRGGGVGAVCLVKCDQILFGESAQNVRHPASARHAALIHAAHRRHGSAAAPPGGGGSYVKTAVGHHT